MSSKFHILFFFILFSYCNIYAFENNRSTQEPFFSYTKEQKLLYLNTAAGASLVAYGYLHWEYDILHTKPHARSEGWFERESKHGGADKMGHLYVGYLSSHLFSYIYDEWGYTQNSAALYGAYSSLLFTTVMEVADSFSGFGLSYEDMVSNIAGALFGYVTYKYDTLGKVIDYRVEYSLRYDTYKEDFTTDYENIKYIFAIKASGFSPFKESYLKYLECYVGYEINGFHKEPYIRERELFIGLGLNLSEIFNTKLFNYYQVPNIYLAK